MQLTGKRYQLPRIVKFTGILIAAVLIASASMAYDAPGRNRNEGVITGWRFFPLQIGLGLDSCKNLVDQDTVTILATGLFGVKQTHGILSFGACVEQENNYGVCAAFLLGLNENNYALAVGMENVTERNYGIKIGLVNITGFFDEFQLVGINFFDIATVGFVQLDGVWNGDKRGRRIVLSVGAVNAVENKEGVFCGFQFGIVNSGGSFQIGLLNYNPRSYLPWMPLINFDMGRAEKREFSAESAAPLISPVDD